MPNRDIRVIQSVQRAIDIINCFSEHELKLTLPQISARTGLNINTARGLVNTLLANGYLEHIPEGNFYMLGPVFLPKADLAAMNDIDRLRSRVRPKLELIADHFQVSARMQRISNDNIFAVEVVNPIDSHYIFLTRLNAVFTLNATASGKLVLYYMDATRREAFYRTFVPTKYTKHTLTTRDELEAELERIGAQGYSTEFDEFLTDFIPGMRDDDILIVTADHGCDPGFKGTDHTREYIPFLAYGKPLKKDVNLGTRVGFTDIAKTVTDIFGIDAKEIPGESFLKDMLK